MSWVILECAYNLTVKPWFHPRIYSDSHSCLRMLLKAIYNIHILGYRYIYICILYTYVCIMYMYVWMYICVCMYVYVSICTFVCVYVSMYMYYICMNIGYGLYKSDIIIWPDKSRKAVGNRLALFRTILKKFYNILSSPEPHFLILYLCFPYLFILSNSKILSSSQMNLWKMSYIFFTFQIIIFLYPSFEVFFFSSIFFFNFK